MLRALNQHGGIAAAEAGDKNAWQAALNGYLGSPYPPLWNLIDSLNSSLVNSPDQERISPPSTSSSGVAVAIGIVALVGGVGYGLYKAFEARPSDPDPEPWYPEPSFAPQPPLVRRVRP